MNRTILIFLFFIGTSGALFSQIEINVGIYTDSTLTKPFHKVKLILKSKKGKKTFRTDKNGKFNIKTKKGIKKYTLEIKKRGYITVLMTEITRDTTIDVILRKALSVHDKEYEGPSKIIRRN